MSPDRAMPIRLAAEIRAELESVARLVEEHSAAPRADDTYSLRSRASILHDFYTGVERSFVRIADELNGGVPAGQAWHRRLLDDMAIELPGVRPAVLSSGCVRELDEYLRFRHLFRNVYGFTLDPERMRPLEEHLPIVAGRVTGELRRFAEWLSGSVGE